jgi:A/G-specific adenine glycosylase
MWVLLPLRAGRVLLQQRAPLGLWGGLLAPAQFDSFAALQARAFAMDGAAELKPLPPRRHAFTHFTLSLRPYRMDLHHPPGIVCENDHLWLPLVDVDSAALPAPIRTLLNELAAAVRAMT